MFQNKDNIVPFRECDIMLYDELIEKARREGVGEKALLTSALASK